MRRLAPRAWLLFVFFAVLVVFFGVFPGPWFDSGVEERDSQWLITTYAAVAAVLTAAIASTAFRRGERWAWLAFWMWPIFFVVHGILFFVVDFAFAAVGVVALLITTPRRDGIESPSRT